ncbi:ChaB family protein [Aquibacillus koreensis]|uniref:ChaB family protein n=1 Tax=Aquibacillus koreensis TaxID=279446 RepID=A0A9X3WLP6_9BACI|nr:ChaB family protein [Aquibacillus koreensis]MCT2537845.1 ChaB family protein [Aquibacillus koreensis]MDC3421123.1 ChaB family protein [Aquibacillus koreensis]
MPYNSITDLPAQVSKPLPKHAKEIFKEAFNSAEEQYQKEETAFKVAWSAVKEKYSKNDNGEWVKKE